MNRERDPERRLRTIESIAGRGDRRDRRRARKGGAPSPEEWLLAAMFEDGIDEAHRAAVGYVRSRPDDVIT